MRRIRQEDGDKRFHQAMRLRAQELGRSEVELAKQYFAGHLTAEAADGARLINDWWKLRGFPPVDYLVFDEDYRFDSMVFDAVCYWNARLGAARALFELVKDDYLDADGSSLGTERINQGSTDITRDSGGGFRGSVAGTEVFDVQFPGRVRRGPFAKTWEGPTKEAHELNHTVGTPNPARPIGVIASEDIRLETLEAVDGLEEELYALLKDPELTEEACALVNEALKLLTELRDILRRVFTNERDRRPFLSRAGGAAGKAWGLLKGASTGVSAASNAEKVLTEGGKILDGVLGNLG